jgi:hypothetical protein
MDSTATAACMPMRDLALHQTNFCAHTAFLTSRSVLVIIRRSWIPSPLSSCTHFLGYVLKNIGRILSLHSSSINHKIKLKTTRQTSEKTKQTLKSSPSEGALGNPDRRHDVLSGCQTTAFKAPKLRLILHKCSRPYSCNPNASQLPVLKNMHINLLTITNPHRSSREDSELLKTHARTKN